MCVDIRPSLHLAEQLHRVPELPMVYCPAVGCVGRDECVHGWWGLSVVVGTICIRHYHR